MSSALPPRRLRARRRTVRGQEPGRGGRYRGHPPPASGGAQEWGTLTLPQAGLQPGVSHVGLLPVEPQPVLREVPADGSRGGGLQLPGRGGLVRGVGGVSTPPCTGWWGAEVPNPDPDPTPTWSWCSVTLREELMGRIRSLSRLPPARDGMAWHGTAWHGMAWLSTACHRLAWHTTAWHGTAWHGVASHGLAWHNTARHGTTRPGTASLPTLPPGRC